MTSMIKARQELAQLRFKSHAEAMDDFYQMMEGPSPEMQRTGQRHTLSDYY